MSASGARSPSPLSVGRGGCGADLREPADRPLTALPREAAGTAGEQRRRAMRLSRAERSLLVDWWFTVDRVLLASILVIVGAGLLLSLAASPSIALKRGLPTFYFVERHVVFALASVVIMLAVSLLSPAQRAAACARRAARRLRADGARR